jgi:two-component system chemotaxis sensor kinase CheA
VQVVVYTDRGRSAALVVDRIVDIVATPLELLELSTRRGILGPVIIQNRITDLLDVGDTLAALEDEAGLASTTSGVS